MNNLSLKLTNTLTRKVESFIPLDNKKVRMYVCGPTVYDNPHIGNARSNVIYDVLYRVLIGIYGFDNVLFARNITDVDDKIINRAKDENISISQLTEKVTEIFHQDCEYLNCLRPNFEPKATESINEMILMIQRLLDLGHAYESNSHIYFDVNSYPEYAKLSGRDLDKLLQGARIEIDISKRNANDFVLWKPDENEISSFDSPFGRGRPGWHIECSAMSKKYLGEDFDIHGGGADLMFPHHTNEIAQSCSANIGSKFAKYWVHNGFLTSDGEKMSKSLGNFVTTKELRDSGTQGEHLRLFLLNTHYRSPIDYNTKSIEDSKITIDYLYRAKGDFKADSIDFNLLDNDVKNSLLNDLNTHNAISKLLDIAKNIIKGDNSHELKNIFTTSANFLGLLNKSQDEWFKGYENNYEIEALIEDRKQAKANKNYNLADEIRSKLHDMGIILEDKPGNKISWRKK